MNDNSRATDLTALLYCLATCTCCAMIPRISSAQEDSAGESTNQAQIEEVTVTAQRRAESILSVPVSVSALGDTDLENLALRNTTDLAGQVPGLVVSPPGGENWPSFAIRGVSSINPGTSTTSPVAVYVDEVYRGVVAFFSKQLYDLERVEVLSGPQGTLYGRNATGGAINFITAKPDFTTGGYLTVGAGRFGRFDAAGALQSGVTDTFAARLAFATSRDDGWASNVTHGGQRQGATRDYGVRLSMTYEPNDAVEATLRLATSRVGPGMYLNAIDVQPAGVGAGIYSLFHSLYPASNPNTDLFPNLGRWQTATDFRGTNRSASDDATLTLSWHLSPTYDLVSVSSYNRGYLRVSEDVDATPLDVLRSTQGASGEQFAEDLRIASNLDTPLNFIAGAYFDHQRLHQGTTLSYYQDIDFNGDGVRNAQDCLDNLRPNPLLDGAILFPLGCTQRNAFQVERESAAAYVDGNYALTGNLKIILGARYTNEKLDVRDYTAQTLGSDGTPLLNTIPGDPINTFAVASPISESFSKVTGRIGLQYTLSNGTLLYATLSRGFRSGDVNAQALNSPAELTTVQPETLDAAEIGAKGEFLDNRLQVTTAAYYYRYENQQVLNITPEILQTLINFPRSHIKGAEVQVKARPLPTLQLQLGASWLESRVDKAIVSGLDLAGNENTFSPHMTANAGVEWQAVQARLGDLRIFAGGRYVGSYFNDIQNSLEVQSKSSFVVDARATFELHQAPLSLSVYGKNLTNEYYITNQILVGPAFGFDYLHVGPPLTYGAELTYRF